MAGLYVKNYGEYLRCLKKNFSDAKQIPSDGEMRSFISRYNLYLDWEIVIADVRQDICFQILHSKTTADKQKRISSYKEYLVKLKDVFGIPKIMPEDSEIEDFISEFELEKNWGITEKDVSEDLEKIVSGKYDALYKEAIHKPKTSVQKPVKPNPLRKSSIPKPVKQKHSEKKKTNLQVTIFIDGDNHLDEGQKGIEHTTKDTKVRAIFSQEGAKKKFDKAHGFRSNVSSKLVTPGDQAVDNQIKTEVGQLLKKGNQDITIVSQDTGFAKYRDRKKSNKLGNKISTAKSVGERLKKNNFHLSRKAARI